MRYFLDDLEFILEGPDSTIYYLCLGKCQSLILSNTAETEWDMRFSEVEGCNVSDLLKQNLEIAGMPMGGKYIQSIFNLVGKQYQLLFQFVEVGELPQDVTTFDHEFFYENEAIDLE